MVIRSILAAGLALTLSATPSMAGAKDETMADWFPAKPNWFSERREKLSDKRLSFSATYIIDNIANVSGGMRRGATHFCRFDFGIDADLERLAGWTGAKLHANTYAIYRQGLSRNYIANLATVSETKALPSGRKPGVGDPQLRDNGRAGSDLRSAHQTGLINGAIFSI